MIKRYFIREINDMEMVECDVCGGTGKIIGTLTSDKLPEPVENTTLSCPICGGQGKVATGKILHYTVSTVFIYGNASVEDDGRTADYLLGFVCDDESLIDNYKKTNSISSFVDYPGALKFYGNSEPLYDTYEEAVAVMNEKEANWKPELKLVE